ncbi:MAG: hypothetical protein L0177_13690 [Chloroflexi bacterium]|nr:hypothetical protein [Chloroflexota bacterium]
MDIFLDPPTTTVGPGDTFTVDIMVDAGAQTLTGVQAFVDYDSSKLQVQDANAAKAGKQIRGGTTLPIEISNTADVSSQIDYAAGSFSGPVAGSFLLATITFQALEPTVESGTSLDISTSPPRETVADNLGTPLPSGVSGATVFITLSTDLEVTKQGSAAGTAGENITYTITVENNGPDDNPGVTVVDQIPNGTEFVSADLSVGSYNDATGEWSVGPLANGASATLALAVMIDPSRTDDITNTASADSEFDSNPDNDSDQVVTDVVAEADLEVTKADSPDPATAGGTLSYEVTVTNNGPSDAQNVVVTDVLPEGITHVSHDPGEASFNPSTGEWAVGTLTAGASATLTINVIVDAGTPDGTVLENQASVTSDTSDPNAANNTAEARTTVLPEADLRVEKNADQDAVMAGQEEPLTYTVVVTNDGPSDVTNVVVSDVLPEGVTHVSHDPGEATFNPSTGEWSVGTLAASSSATLTVVVSVDSSAQGSLMNTAAVSGDAFDPDEGNNSSTVEVLVETEADVSVDKQASGTITAGSELDYTITVTNNGPSDAQGVVVTDSFPGQVSVNPATPGKGSFDEGTGVWNVGTLAAGDSAQLVVTVVVDPAAPLDTVLINQVDATTATTDPDPENNTDQAQTTVTPEADLQVDKSADQDTVVAGQDGPLTYTVVVTNNGPSNATGVAVSDVLPDGVSFVSSEHTQGSFDEASSEWQVGELPAGESATLTVVVTVDSSAQGNLTNTAAVSGDEFDPNQDDNSSTAEVDITTEADVSVTKLGATEAVAGNTIEYTITVANAGPSDAQNVVVTDTFPTLVMASPATPTSGTFDETTGVWSVGALPSGASEQLVIEVMIDSGAPEGAILANEVEAASSTADPDLSNNSDTLQTTVLLEADLSVSKSAEGSVVAGGQLTYTIGIVNQGPSTATSVVLTDTLPAGMSFDQASSSDGCSASEGVVSCDVGEIAVGEEVEVTIVVAVSPSVEDGTILDNEVVVDGAQLDPNPENNTDSTSTEVFTQADVAVTKVDLPDPALAGETLTYTITVTNNGPSDSQNVTATDTLPAQVTVQSSSADAGSFDAETGAWSIGTLGVGELVELAITVVVDADVPDGSMLANSVAVDSETPDPDEANNSDETETTVATSADLRVEKSSAPDPAVAGQQLAYTVTVHNDGPSDAEGVTVAESLLEGFGVASAAPGQGDFDEETGVWTVGTLAASASAMLTIVVDVPPDTAAGADLTNTAEADADTSDPDGSNNSASVVTSVITLADLSIAKSDSRDPAVAGNKLTYTLTVTNNGPSNATGVVVTDALPSGVSFDSSSDADAFDSATGQWSVGGLGVGEERTLQIVVTVNASTSGAIVNTATVAGDQDDPDSSNDSDAEATQVATPVAAAIGTVTASEGGEVRTGRSNPVDATVLVAPDAVNEDVEVTIQAISSDDPALPSLPDVDAGFSRVFELSPDGQTFSKPVNVIITYTDEEVVGLDESALTPVLFNSITGEWDAVPDCDDPSVPTPDPCVDRDSGDPASNTLVVVTTHFSVYGVTGSKIKIVTITSEDEAMVGDQYFVVVSAEDEGTLAAQGFMPIADAPEILVRMHGLDRIGTDTATHVMLANVLEGTTAGMKPVQAEFDGETHTATLNVVSERTNRNFFLMPGVNFTGLGLVPDNPSINDLLNKPVANASPDFEAAIGRTITLADLVERVFAFDEDAQGNAAFFVNFTQHPCSAPTAACEDPTSGVTPADSLHELAEFQGMVIRTRGEVQPSGGGDLVGIFQMVAVEGFASPVAVPIRTNVEGKFLDVSATDPDTGAPLIPDLSKELRVGWNLIAPHIAEATTFEEAFRGALNPVSLADRALSFIRQVGIAGGAAAIQASIVEQSVARSGDGVIEPQFSYWLFIKPFINQSGQEVEVRPVIRPVGP